MRCAKVLTECPRMVGFVVPDLIFELLEDTAPGSLQQEHSTVTDGIGIRHVAVPVHLWNVLIHIFGLRLTYESIFGKATQSMDPL
mmetsp:Transcript_15467/g.39919  ORF Transcript_15467/g.39919 Transcript_15467/m.39919 type:complete len:85 (-) Transcript_15467:959-1213(-)